MEESKRSKRKKGGGHMKRIAVVNDLSGLGRCSLSAALPVLSVMGLECCPLPTAVLSNQTGYDSFSCCDLTDGMGAYLAEWKKRGVRFDGFLTGYLASVRQVQHIEALLDGFQTPQSIFVCDPVMADDGRVYDTYDDALCRAVMRLARRANVITPNLSELCLLCGAAYDALAACAQDGDFSKPAALARSLLSERLHTVVVTGLRHGGEISCVLVTKTGETVVTGRCYGGSYSGTGDLFSAALTGELVRETDAETAVRRTVRFLEASIADSFRAGTDRNDGVDFQTHLEMVL